MTEFPFVKFPAAYYGCGRAYMELHRHSDAVAVLKLGVELVPAHSPTHPLLWPATNRPMEDWRPEVIEVRGQGQGTAPDI